MVHLYGQDKLISIKMNSSLTRFFLLLFFRRFWDGAAASVFHPRILCDQFMRYNYISGEFFDFEYGKFRCGETIFKRQINEKCRPQSVSCRLHFFSSARRPPSADCTKTKTSLVDSERSQKSVYCFSKGHQFYPAATAAESSLLATNRKSIA